MSEASREGEKWIFVAGLTLLAAVFAWQLIRPDDAEISIPRQTTDNTFAPRPFIYQPVPDNQFTLEELKYFDEIAFTAEHQVLEPAIRKWVDDLVIRIEGAPTQQDLEAVDAVIAQLNDLQDEVRLRKNVFSANVVIRFAPEDTFHTYNQRYVPTNYGFFWARWIDNQIYAANILIDNSVTSQEARNALILEELTQAMGLMNASSTHPDSVFNDDRGLLRQTLAPIDRQLVRMLYHPQIKPAMTPDEALTVLSQLSQKDTDADQTP